MLRALGILLLAAFILGALVVVGVEIKACQAVL